jgi:hypothetical protein
MKTPSKIKKFHVMFGLFEDGKRYWPIRTFNWGSIHNFEFVDSQFDKA